MLGLFLAVAWLGWLNASVAVHAADEDKAAAKKKPSAAKEAAADAAAEPLATAKKYRKEQVDASQKKQRQVVQTVLRSGAATPEQQTQLDKYYKNYAFPRWTLPENYASLHEYRRELRAELGIARSGAIYDWLLQTSFEWLKKAAAEAEYHPAIRYNAMFAIGDLNTQEQGVGSSAVATPLPAARAVLIEAIRNKDQLEAVKVAALQGLVRHAGLAREPQTRDGQLIPVFLEIIKKPLPSGRPDDGDVWMRSLALRGLGLCRQAGADGSIATTLVAIVVDKHAPVSLRIAAARALGDLEMKGNANLKAIAVAGPLANLAVECYWTEQKRPAPQGASASTNMRGGMMSGSRGSRGGPTMSGPGMMGPGMGPGGMMGDSMSEADQEHVVQFRRRLKTCLVAVRYGLTGPEQAVRPGEKPREDVGAVALAAEGSPEKTFIKSVAAAIKKINDALDNTEATFDELDQKLAAPVKDIVTAINATPGAAPPAPAKEPAPESPDAKGPPAAAPAPKAPAPAPKAPAPAAKK
jgi:hypothetical protein